MAKILLDDIIKMLGLEYGEFFSLKGSNHSGSRKHGNEFDYVFLPYHLLHAIFPKERNEAILKGDTRQLCSATSDFHALCTGMLKVVKAPEGKKQYVLGYPENKHTAIEDFSNGAKQGSLF